MFRFFKSSVVSQLVAITLGLIFLSTATIVGVMHSNLRGYVMADATMDARDASRAMAVLYGMKVPEATVEIKDGTLSSVTEDKMAALPDHDLVDRTAQTIGGVATVFEKQGSDYVRISTNVKKENGDRAVGTKLAADHPAQALLARGEAYYGPAVLFGRDYITGYFPVKNASGANVGMLFIGIPTEVYFSKINYLQYLILAIGIGVMIVVGVLAYAAIRASIRPLGILTGSVETISTGNLDVSVPYLDSKNEFGGIARALAVFRENALSKRQMEIESESRRLETDEERTRRDLEKREMDREIDFAVNALAAGLGRLSQGDLTQQIDTPFTGRLEQLRTDFNGSVTRLQETLSHIRDNAQAIQHNGGRMLSSADALSKRTEAQAASLEETAAAVEQITATVKSSSGRAQETNRAVAETKKSADSSASVVSNAIAAMGRIEDASRQIEQIIDVIDEIAFQTNLLALNAGIEAARAGDAGKGFAVVAQEVRELAQRSAGAAKEIKTLIDKSTSEVNTGSALVQETGAVLASISQQIVAISQHVEMIATASRDQSAALQEVNGSVNQMDQMTQQNASMVAETTNASRELAGGADMLMVLVEQFRLEQGNTLRPVSRAA
ncbi:chemotaxis protein [Pararhizobium polonicum]|uniref:Chemotaxis protein n=1 Tax=Pararhizobium polonicum TaxID=1612624 RepID=A0A1C7NUR3_9HYPH|nr:methyl-accepting chemotaxis protein [Pararhizobium polonicum]OBZ92741.1 chemotaxis protein [Pararhizobium polonicum]